MGLELNILINKIQRIPFLKIGKVIYDKKKEFFELPFMDQKIIYDFISERQNIRETLLSKEEIMFDTFLFNDLNKRAKIKGDLREITNQELEALNLNLMSLVESLQDIDSDMLEDILRNYHTVFDSKVVETLIINLQEDKQIFAIQMCKAELMASKPITFNNFIASVNKDAQRFILENFEQKLKKYSSQDMSSLITYLYKDNISVCVNKYEVSIEQPQIQSQYLDPYNLMELIFANSISHNKLLKLVDYISNKLIDVSIPYFKTYIRRLKAKDRFDSIYIFKEKFSQMSLDEIIELFESDSDEVKAKVLIEFYDKFTGEISPKLRSFITQSVKAKMSDFYEEKRREEFIKKKEAGVDLINEFSVMIASLRDDNRNILFDDKYISAITLARILLLEDKSINDNNPSYIKLRQEYMEYLFKILSRDNTIDNFINNSMFYRIVNQDVSFSQIYSLTTAKTLIYLSRNSQVENAYTLEYIVSDLSEKQVQNYNMKLYKKLCKRIKETYEKSSPLENHIKKLAFKLFFGFGYDNALKILEYEKPFSTLEYLFNGLKIMHIELNEDGTPRLNKKLMNYLFGSKNNSKHAAINKLLNDEIINFDKCFSSIYNDWDSIYKKLNGNISTKRILELYKEQVIFLNPEEYRLKEPLREIGTTNMEIVKKAREWYLIMKKRKYSSIPKVKGNVNNYEYEMLDLDDPLALAVGYITRCCFLIDGESKESLYHSISSENGRTFVVRKDGELVAQSWVWRNGNALCFDNVETRGNYSQDTLLEVYQKASEELLEESNQVENETESLKVITYGTSESRMSKPKMIFEGTLPKVLENVGYSDAIEEQYILAEIKHKSLYYGNVVARYKDTGPQITHRLDYLRVPQSELHPIRRLIEETSFDITAETIEFIRNIENQAYPEEMKVMKDAEDIEDLSDVYGYFESEITIARNRDWYIVYGEDEDSVEILDIASSTTRDIEASRREIHDYFAKVINRKAIEDNKPVTLNAKEDTSYRMIQRMVNNGEYEIVEDTVNTWETDDSIIMHNLILTPITERENDRNEIT